MKGENKYLLGVDEDMTSVICCWPRDIDYPYFRWVVNKNRELFGRVVIVMTQSATGRDFTNFVKANIINPVVITDYPYDGRDWRNSALTAGLKEMTGDDVLFLEQDFLMEKNFLPKLLEAGKNYHTVGISDGDRLHDRFHPCCLLVKSAALARTHRDFSVKRDVGDHFYRVSLELRDFGGWTTLTDLGLKYHHLSGLTQNYRCFEKGDMAGLHLPNQFLTYNRYARSLDVPMEPEMTAVMDRVKEGLGYKPEDETVKSFFDGIIKKPDKFTTMQAGEI